MNEIQWQVKKSEQKTSRYGRRREGRWTPTRAKAQDTRASPYSLETHLVRKRGDIGHLWALSPWSDGCRAYFNSLNGGRFVPKLSGFVPPLKCVPPPMLCVRLR